MLFNIFTIQFYSSNITDARLLPCIHPKMDEIQNLLFLHYYNRNTGLRTQYYETIFGQERTNISLNNGNYQETDDF